MEYWRNLSVPNTQSPHLILKKKYSCVCVCMCVRWFTEYHISNNFLDCAGARLEGKQKRRDLKVGKGHVLSPMMFVVPAVYPHDGSSTMEKILFNKPVLTREHRALTSF